MTLSLTYFLISLFFFTTISMHAVRKNAILVVLYAVQSLAVVLLLMYGAWLDQSIILSIVALFALLVKTTLIPRFFGMLISKNLITFSSSTYLKLPITALIVAGLAVLPSTHVFAPLLAIAPQHAHEIAFSLGAFFISCFMLVNRRDGMSQMIGLLSLENSIVAFAFFAGLEQSAMLQIGIIFDVLVWVFIATLLASLAYKQFGTLDTDTMRHLTE